MAGCGVHGGISTYWDTSFKNRSGWQRGTFVIVPGKGGGALPGCCLVTVCGGATANGGPLLVHADGSCLSRFQFVAVFRKCPGAAGLDPKQYGSHSFRIGAATEASQWGLNDTAVKQIGRSPTGSGCTSGLICCRAWGVFCFLVSSFHFPPFPLLLFM